MTFKKKLLINSTLLTIVTILSNLFAYLIIILITRKLGIEELGIYSIIFAFPFFFFSFLDLGLNQYFARKIAQKGEENGLKFLAPYNFLRISASGLIFIIFLLSSYTIYKEHFFLLFLVGIQIITSTPLLLYNMIYRNRISLFGTAFQELSLKLSVFLYLLLANNPNLYLIIIIMTIVSFLLMLLFHINIKNSSDLYHFKGLNKKILLEEVKKNWHFVVIGLLSAHVYLDTIIISKVGTIAETGTYNLIIKFVLLFSIISFVLTYFTQPIIFKNTSNTIIKFFYSKIIYLYSVLFFPLITGAILIAERLFLFIYSTKIDNINIYLPLALMLSFLIMVTNLIFILLYSKHKEKFVLKALINISVLKIILIIVGTIVLNNKVLLIIISSVISLLILTIYVHQELHKFCDINYFQYLLGPLFASLLMYLILKNFLNLYLPYVILLGIGLYFFFLIILEELILKRKNISNLLKTRL